MADEWSYTAGKRASGSRPSSKVRVYERPSREGIFMTCAWRTTGSGRPKEERLPPGTSREQAVDLADQTALERRLQIVKGEALDAEDEKTTLDELFEAYMESEQVASWTSEKHRKDQERANRMWKQELGSEVPVEELTPHEVEKAAGELARRNDWSARTQAKYMKHLHAAVRWGFRKARFYDRNPIVGIDMPESDPDTSDLVYTKEEARKLLTPHEDIDWRVTIDANVQADTGRRLSAVRQIRKEDLLMTDDGRLLIRFRSETDKAGKASVVPVSDQTARLIADALEKERVQKSEYLLPAGRLGYDEDIDKPIGAGTLIDKLHEAEDVLEIPRVENRATHALKRLHVTVGMEVSQGDTSIVGDVTGTASAELLRQVYRQQDTERITRQVDAVREALEEGEDE